MGVVLELLKGRERNRACPTRSVVETSARCSRITTVMLQDLGHAKKAQVRIAAEEQPQWLRNLRLDKRGPLNDSDIETWMEDRPRCACPFVRPTPLLPRSTCPT